MPSVKSEKSQINKKFASYYEHKTIKNSTPKCISFLTFQFSALVENNGKKLFCACHHLSKNENPANLYLPAKKVEGVPKKLFPPHWNKTQIPFEISYLKRKI